MTSHCLGGCSPEFQWGEYLPCSQPPARSDQHSRSPHYLRLQDISASTLPFRRFIAAHEADALGHVRHRTIPVMLIFDGDIALESLALQFVEDGRDVRNSGAVR